MSEDTLKQGKMNHPVRALLGHYRRVFKAAWHERFRLDGPTRSGDEVAFLPAALSLQESPPHPLPRRLAWVLMALFVIALAWTCIGQVDIVAVAPGRIVVSERTKVIQPLEASVVRQVLVRDGDHVQAGQVLVELDPTMAEADRSSVNEQYLAALSDELRSGALLKALDGGQLTPPAQVDVGLSASLLRQQLQAEWQDITLKRGKLQAESTRKQAELGTARELMTKLETTVPLSRQRETDYQTLVAQGFMSGHATQDRSRERIELERDLATQRARVVEAQAGLAESRAC